MDAVSPMTSIMRDLDLRRKANRDFEKKVNKGHYNLGRQFTLAEFPDNSKVCTRLRVAQLLREGGTPHQGQGSERGEGGSRHLEGLRKIR